MPEGRQRWSESWPWAGAFGLPALVLLLVLSGVWGWWAWQAGAYFGVVLLPGGIVLCLIAGLFAWVAPWPAGSRLRRPTVIALGALIALGAWEALSALWSPAPDVAVADGQRVLIYALAFGLGAWLCVLLGARMNLSLLPLAFAGAVGGVVVIAALLTSDTPRDLLDSGTLDYPLGYRNAVAAFFGVAMFAAAGLASDRDRSVWLRALSLGTATLAIDFLLLAQSRGSILAMPVALVVYTLAAPERVRALSWLLLAMLPAVAIVPPLTALYEAGQDGAADAVAEMRTAGAVAAATAVLAIVLGALAARFERRLPGLGSASTRANRGIGLALAGIGLALVIAFVAAVGNPVSWVSDRAKEFSTTGSPDLSAESSRFGFNAGSERYDLWRVALDEFSEDPVLGAGGGGFHYEYLKERTVAARQARDAHSVELETMSEFGIPGIGLLLIALVACFVGAHGARAAGGPAAGLAAIAMSGGAYWLVHSSIDWFWPYPAVTAPLLGVLGAASAATLRPSAGGRRLPWRLPLAVCVAILAVSAVPPFLSERYVNQAYAEWRVDLSRAYDDLDRAQKLNRLSDTPLLAEGAIALAAGDRRRALDAFREAEAKRPEEWASHYLLAKLQLHSDRAEARRQISIALEHNPLDPDIDTLARRLGVQTER
jgi:hypothetical protein